MTFDQRGLRVSITTGSNRKWLSDHPLKLDRYIRRSHKREDRNFVRELAWEFADEGRKLVGNFSKADSDKKQLLIEWLYYSPQITCGVFADQRMGKDALVCEIFQEVIDYCKKKGLTLPRIVTLGNMRKPPFVTDEDMYFSFKNIPSGSKEREVWIYSSEIETHLPARQGLDPENKLFSMLEGTLAQNHQKLFGCCKLASKVDLNFIRGMNVKLFKYISKEKLNIEGVERVNVLSPLGSWLLPHDITDKTMTLLAFDNNLFTCSYPLPNWWSDEYSEQFRDVPLSKVWDFVETSYSENMKPQQLQTILAQKFRKNLSIIEIENHLKEEGLIA